MQIQEVPPPDFEPVIWAALALKGNRARHCCLKHVGLDKYQRGTPVNAIMHLRVLQKARHLLTNSATIRSSRRTMFHLKDINKYLNTAGTCKRPELELRFCVKYRMKMCFAVSILVLLLLVFPFIFVINSVM
jgi:hypothetical protein